MGAWPELGTPSPRGAREGGKQSDGKENKQNVTRSDLYFWSNFAGTLGVSHNAAHIGFVYTSLSLKDHRDGWLQRGGGLGGAVGGGIGEGGVKDGLGER